MGPADGGAAVDGRALVAGLVHCARQGDPDAWKSLWEADPQLQATAAAGLSAFSAHLLARVGDLTGGDPDLILREFALGVAASTPDT